MKSALSCASAASSFGFDISRMLSMATALFVRTIDRRRGVTSFMILVKENENERYFSASPSKYAHLPFQWPISVCTDVFNSFCLLRYNCDTLWAAISIIPAMKAIAYAIELWVVFDNHFPYIKMSLNQSPKSIFASCRAAPSIKYIDLLNKRQVCRHFPRAANERSCLISRFMTVYFFTLMTIRRLIRYSYL